MSRCSAVESLDTIAFQQKNEWAGSVKATDTGDNKTGVVLLPGPLHRTSEESKSI